MLLGEDDLSNERKKKGHLLKRRYFFAVGLSSMKMVADRHRHAAYHYKQLR